MNWKLISLGSFGILSIIASLIDIAADNRFSENSSKKAVEQHTAEIDKDLEDAQKTIDYADDILAKERKEVLEFVKTWKRDNDYDAQIRGFHQNAVRELQEFKDSINYGDRKQKIEDDFEDALEAYKESVDYDFELKALEAEMDEAKALYKKRCKILETASRGDDDISDALNDLKKNQKEQMEESVKEIKGKISDLKNKLSAEENRLARKKQTELRELEQELASTRTRLNKAEADACDKLSAEKEKAEEKFRKDIIARRNDSELRALEESDACKKLISDQKEADIRRAHDIYSDAPRHEKWAEWLNAKDCPKWLFIFVSGLPLIPLGYLVRNYVRFIYQTVKAM